ncbi:FAD:protein FMN transferase [Pseudoflavonifractor phocaeensis]|uniref:FAD:protein FMN transferase n=1 Tax=Pseudoflavonifractor phocaeensis TaxID=1870988 RepID=UPI001F367A3E|nr:FAD:protein FMN transferase [Pseudoflavonifractor phocaeensis]
MPALTRARRPLALALAGAMLCALLTGCQQKDEKNETTIFAMDTVMNLTVWGGQEALDGVVAAIYDLERQFSATDENSPIYTLNHSAGTAVELPEAAAGLLDQALQLCRVTGGALDITAYPAVKAWGFTTGDYRVPSQTELDALACHIDYSTVRLEPGSSVLIPEGVEVDLGAVAKGYTGDVLAEELKAQDVASALLDLGQSSILAIGAKPDGSPWRIGIQDPAGEGYLGVLKLEDMAMGTSGGYQRYFEEDGVRYWHIIDPDTAAPARSGLASVTVVSPSGLTCDGLSTALFVMGLEEGTAFWRAHRSLEFDVIFITDDGSVFITSGLEESFSLAQGYEDREVTVLS